jgi:hypothetical protein
MHWTAPIFKLSSLQTLQSSNSLIKHTCARCERTGSKLRENIPSHYYNLIKATESSPWKCSPSDGPRTSPQPCSPQ